MGSLFGWVKTAVGGIGSSAAEMINPMTKILAAVVVVLLFALGSLGFLYRMEVKASGAMSERNSQLSSDLNHQVKTIEDLRAKMVDNEKLLADRERDRDRIEKSLSAAKQRLAKMEAENAKVKKWASTRVPDPVLRELRDDPPSSQDRDDHAGASGSSPGKLPGTGPGG